jgi:hypothetical protein
MEKITLKGTFETPSVLLDSEEGKLEFSGRSLPEDSTSFYRPILRWIEQYVACPNGNTNIAIKLEYFNTATSKVLLAILSKFENASNVTVHWFHYEEDEDMLESGKEFEELVKLPFAYHTFE